MPKNRKEVEDEFLLQIRAVGLPLPAREAKIIEGRKFRFDFVWDAQKLAVDVQGGIWILSGHSTGVGIERDCTKLCLAVLAGYRVMFVTTGMVKSGQAIKFVEQALIFKRNV